MAYRVVLRSAGRIERSSGNRSARIFCSSTFVVTRDAGITSPLLITFEDGVVGSSMLMYFWPNSVVGRISMSAFWGMSLADDGFSATLMTAWCPSFPTLRTCPTSTPWRRTSPNWSSWRPAFSAWMVTIVGCEKALA